jgi:multidrug efflux pump subunit AcrA (membrane-fusion protein)
MPIEKRRFRGKITFVDPQVQPVAETAVRIRAEFENPGDLRPGLMVQMTIFITTDAAAAGAETDAPTRTARSQ